jgi:hypothetical protein
MAQSAGSFVLDDDDLEEQPFQQQGPRLTVRFLVRWNSYFRGDVAAFPTVMARALVQGRRAQAVNVVSEGTPPRGARYAMRYPVKPRDRDNGNRRA